MGRFMTRFTTSAIFKKICHLTFKKVDKDKTGTINKDELFYAMCIFCCKMNDKVPHYVELPTEEEVNKLYDEFGTESPGQLKEAEFEEFIRRWIDKEGHNFALALTTGLAVNFIVIPQLAEGTRHIPVLKKIPGFVFMGIFGAIYEAICMRVYK